MDWIGLVSSVAALFAGLGLYIIFVNSKLGKKYEHYQYGVMVVILILACLFGGLLKYALGLL